MKKPEFQRFRGRTVITATAIAQADGRFRPDAVIHTQRLEDSVDEAMPFDGPLFDSYFDAAQYALESADEIYVKLQRARTPSQQQEPSELL